VLNHQRQGAGQTVVLLHGLFGSCRYWSFLVDYLSPTYDVVSLDLPGFGDSSTVPVPKNVAGYGAVVFEFLQSLGIESFSVLGHSLGGAIAQQMSLDYPDEINKMVAYATKPAVLDEDRFESFEKTLDRILNSDIDDVVKSQAANWFDAGADAQHFQLCLDAAQGVTSASAGACVQAIRGWDVRDQLDKLEMPVLIVSGDRDRSVSLETLVGEKQAIKNAQLSILPGCGHMAHLESPQVFNQVIHEFISAPKKNKSKIA
jgi:2-hydroxy-6-oxonona-2,4-dienedioate hydrolase